MRCLPWPKRCHERQTNDAAFQMITRWMPLEKAPDFRMEGPAWKLADSQSLSGDVTRQRVIW